MSYRQMQTEYIPFKLPPCSHQFLEVSLLSLDRRIDPIRARTEDLSSGRVPVVY